MNRVKVTKCMVGICGMQVCAVKDATDEEILAVCNRENPSGTSNGWSEVVREIDESCAYRTKNMQPGQCETYEDRMHFIVIC
jgi:hypothetical protein